MEGKGQSFWKNGTPQYVGQFRFSVKEGVGKQQFATGTYEGEWFKNQPHGRGCWVWKNGARFVGSMNKGKREGFGILFYPDGQSIEYEGMWENDLLNGESKHFSPSGELWFAGEYVNGLRQGSGRSYKDGQLSYSGSYFGGKKDGRGVKYHPDGSILYRGGWRKGLYHGRGELEGGKVMDFRNGHSKAEQLQDALLQDEEE
jgi:antitoxin component YwqK of YwqJK toxin-antitoxin module